MCFGFTVILCVLDKDGVKMCSWLCLLPCHRVGDAGRWGPSELGERAGHRRHCRANSWIHDIAMAHKLSPSDTRIQQPGLREGTFQQSLKPCFHHAAAEKSIDLSSLLCFLTAAWSKQDMRENNQPWVQYWHFFICNWGIFPKCAARVAAMSACPYLIWGGGWFVCLEEAPVTQTGLREMSGGCGSFGWCSQCCGVGCCQGELGELSVSSQLCV